MKNTFKEYHPLTQEEIDELWVKSIFIFDTNVLLNLYRYSKDTSSKFIETIKLLNDRVWLPYQVGLEFNKNRLTVISDQKKCYSDFEKKINNLVEEVENNHRNPFISDELLNKLYSIRKEIKEEINNKISYYDGCLVEDEVFSKINLVFQNKIGKCLTQEEIKKIYSEGDKRYKEKIPPGYKDCTKPETERYGDLIIWKQVISKAKEGNKFIIFVLDDKKEDWWLEHQGRTISPRPELLREFRTETGGNCHFYKPFQFLEFSNKYLDSKISTDIIEEVKQHENEIEYSRDNPFVILEITIRGMEKDFNLFISDLRTSGYKFFFESKLDDLFYLNVILPNIPDLERRFNDRYLMNLLKYNIELISKEIKIT